MSSISPVIWYPHPHFSPPSRMTNQNCLCRKTNWDFRRAFVVQWQKQMELAIKPEDAPDGRLEWIPQGGGVSTPEFSVLICISPVARNVSSFDNISFVVRYYHLDLFLYHSLCWRALDMCWCGGAFSESSVQLKFHEIQMFWINPAGRFAGWACRTSTPLGGFKNLGCP